MLDRLIRVDNAVTGKSYVYTYDKDRNVSGKDTYANTTGTLETAQSTVAYTFTSKQAGKIN